MRKGFPDDSVIITITCAKVNEWDEKINLTNYPATRFYLNADHHSVKQLLAKSKEPSFGSTNPFEHEEEIKYITAVKDIQKLNAEYIQKRVTCAITVRKVETHSNWFYKKCTKCEDEVILVGGNYTCKTCGRNIPFPNKRFRILTLCSDNSGSIPVIFPDHEIRKLISKSVFEVQLEENGKFPTVLTEFEDHKFTVTLLITEDNINHVCDAYNVVEIKPLLEPVSALAQFETDDDTNHDSSTITVAPNAEITCQMILRLLNVLETKAKGRKFNESVEEPEDISDNPLINKTKGRRAAK